MLCNGTYLAEMVSVECQCCMRSQLKKHGTLQCIALYRQIYYAYYAFQTIRRQVQVTARPVLAACIIILISCTLCTL